MREVGKVDKINADLKKAGVAIDRASRESTKWSGYDQLLYVTKIVEFGQFCDSMLAKYDGRQKRLEKILKGEGK